MIATTKTRIGIRRHDWPQVNDQELIRLCLTGEEDAWREVVERFGRLVCSVATRLGLGREEVDDVFQFVFAALHQHLKSIRDRTRLASWLVTTARRESFRVGRQARRTISATEIMLGQEAADDEYDARPEHQHLVRLALRRLGDRDRALVQALFQSTTTPDYNTIAADLGMKVGSIGPTRARALERLRVQLQKIGVDEAE